MADEREELRLTFDMAATLYDRARPKYPAAVFDRLHEAADLCVPSNLLEIGPGPGTATRVMAERGHHVTAVELGPELASVARLNLAGHDTVDIVSASFDTWEPPSWGAFDLAFAATAWHWLDPESKYQRVHRHLRPGGSLSFWSALHVVPVGGDPFFEDLHDVYDSIGEARPDDAVFPRPGELRDHTDEIEASGLFDVVLVEHHDWEVVYDADAYIELLSTFSGHIAMGATKRDILYRAIRERLAARSDGLLRRHWGCVVHIARRR